MKGGRWWSRTWSDLLFVDTAAGRIPQTLALPRPKKKGEEISFSVVGLAADGDRIYSPDSERRVRVARRQADGDRAWATPIEALPPAVMVRRTRPGSNTSPPAGSCGSRPRGRITSTACRPTEERPEAVVVGVAPFAICFPRADRCYVTNWGGDPPRAGDSKSLSSGTPVRIDPRTSVANDGTVSVLARVGRGLKQIMSIRVGLHPSRDGPRPGKRLLYVANANSDTVSVIDTRTDEVVETISCRPEGRLPFGSGSNALAVSPDGTTLYVANGTNNCVAVVALGRVDAPGREVVRPANPAARGLDSRRLVSRRSGGPAGRKAAYTWSTLMDTAV